MNQNECKYQAVSVVKPKELITCTGRITDIVPKWVHYRCSLWKLKNFSRFCYVECKKFGKVFVPFSARLNMSTKHWLGKGAERNREVQLKVTLSTLSP